MRFVVTILGLLAVAATIVGVVLTLSGDSEPAAPPGASTASAPGTGTAEIDAGFEAMIRGWIRTMAAKKYTDPKKQKHDRGVLFVKLENRGFRTVKVVEKMLAGYEEDSVKFYCLMTLRHIARRYKAMDRIYPIFVRVLENRRNSGPVRAAAAQQIAGSGAKEAFDSLRIAWKDDPAAPSDLRLMLLKQISRLKHPDAADFLKEAFESAVQPAVRAQALRAFGDTKDERAFESALGAVGDANLRVRMTAAGVLGLFGERGLEPLRRARLKEKHPAVRKMMGDIIKKIEKR